LNTYRLNKHELLGSVAGLLIDPINGECLECMKGELIHKLVGVKPVPVRNFSCELEAHQNSAPAPEFMNFKQVLT
jgi:hypothetical protein